MLLNPSGNLSLPSIWHLRLLCRDCKYFQFWFSWNRGDIFHPILCELIFHSIPICHEEFISASLVSFLDWVSLQYLATIPIESSIAWLKIHTDYVCFPGFIQWSLLYLDSNQKTTHIFYFPEHSICNVIYRSITLLLFVPTAQDSGRKAQQNDFP